MVRAMVSVDPVPVMTVPVSLSTLTTGWVVNVDPDAAAIGEVVKTSLYSLLPELLVGAKDALVPLASPESVAVKVYSAPLVPLKVQPLTFTIPDDAVRPPHAVSVPPEDVSPIVPENELTTSPSRSSTATTG